MSVFKSKSIQITILLVYGIVRKQFLLYFSALLLPLLPIRRPIISLIITVLSFANLIIKLDPIAIILVLLTIGVHIFYHGISTNIKQQQKPKKLLSSKYLIFMYFFAFSLLSISQFKPIHYSALVLLYIMLAIYLLSTGTIHYLRYSVQIISFITFLWGIASFYTQYSQHQFFKYFQEDISYQWWYYSAIVASNWLGFMLNEQIKLQLLGQCEMDSINSNQNDNKNEIEMVEVYRFSAHSANQNRHHSMDDVSSNSNRRNKLPSIPQQIIMGAENTLTQKLLDPKQSMDLNKHRQIVLSSLKNKRKRSDNPIEQKNKQCGQQKERPKTSFSPFQFQSNPQPHTMPPSNTFNSLNLPNPRNSQPIASQQSQQQLTNLFLLIPFTLFKPCVLHIPIYGYLICLQTGKTPLWVFYAMFVSICALTAFENEASLKLEILLRLCLILLVNKNFKIAINITRVLRSIWLRSSFVFVLLVLFWFSLLTVNLFHIAFVIIVLLFITKNNNTQSKQPSFRHRNWKYLILLFNIFLISRLLWLILKTDINLSIPLNFHDILSIIGVTYDYGLSLEYFNIIPLIVSGVLTVQYWTYSSRIYDLQSKKTLQFLPTYRAFILKILRVLTIIYYKLIPWTSHLVVIVIIISLQFSLIADIVLIWSLFILFVHMIRPNEIEAYRVMHRMWNVFLRLVSIQIILRYIFEFIKFPLIFSHISQFPIIKTLIRYQEFLGLAIRQSSNSYIKNIFTKFQLMMILDFAIIAISFITTEYYQIMIKYYQLLQKKQQELARNKSMRQEAELEARLIQKQDKNSGIEQSKQNQAQQQQAKVSNQDAIFIYQNYIDFKLTLWLQSLNDLMLICSKIFLKLYYPLLGTYSCLYYSYSSFLYFLCCVYYYLKRNLKYYELYVVKKLQPRIMNLFHRWRISNNIRTNQVGGLPIGTDEIIGADYRRGVDAVVPGQADQRVNQEDVEDNPFNQQSSQRQQAPTTRNAVSLYKHLKTQLTVTNSNILFSHLMSLHSTLRIPILILTMTCIVLNYTSRTFVSPEIRDFFQQDTVRQIRKFLYLFGASIEAEGSINLFLLIVGLTVLEIKCCSLLNRIGRPRDVEQVQFEAANNEGTDSQRNLVEQETKQIKKFIDVSISIRLGINKIIERFFVILLVFVSILQNQSPFSIIYLFCAWFLNYMGSKSIQALSVTLATLITFQYSLIITDTYNKYTKVLHLFPQAAHYSWFVELFRIEDQEWIVYLEFGKNLTECFILYLSLVILMLYQVCFYIQEYNWIQILDKMFEKINIGGIYLKIYEKISQVFEYALVYSPLFIIILCLGLYLMDFTATNMSLSILSLIFLFKSFLLQDYANSRSFWKSYFRILQLLIVIFMAIYCVLSTPMYNQYCNKFLCSPEEFRTKVTKTILLLILQIGIDIISSHHFKNAMNTLENTLNQTSSYYRIAISIVQNDRKIQKQFQSAKKKQNIKRSLVNIREFLNSYENDPSVRYDNKRQPQSANQPWLETILNFLPSFIDSSLIRSPEETRIFVRQENEQFIKWLQGKNGQQLSDDELKNINQLYVNQFVDCKDTDQLIEKLKTIVNKNTIEQVEENLESSIQSVRPLRRQTRNIMQSSHIQRLRSRQIKDFGVQSDDQQGNNVRKSYMQGILPFEEELQILGQSSRHQIYKSVSIRQVKQSQAESQKDSLPKNIKQANKQQKKKLLYLKMFESIVSNWHYLTYILMILQFVINMGVLTLPFPILTFALGIVHSYQAPKSVWRLAFLALLPPIFFKYSLQIQLIKPGKVLQFILIGSNNNSILVEYLLMFFIVIQCLILKIAGLYDQSTDQVQCMNIALIRNIINVDQKNIKKQQQRARFYALLQQCKKTSDTFFQYLFSKYECKTGYDYSTLMVTVQLIILMYIFIFYDRMAVREELTFYKMIQYNQFTTGMVVMAFIQLGFMLIDRILAILQLTYNRWDVTLIIKYIILVLSLVYIHAVVLAFFPINANYFGRNNYIVLFYILHLFYFLISSLQVKVGMNKESRGFMDRYSWYNGYIYMTYRAIPFLFEFKIFSDWTFTTTSLRLFDWIKYEEIFGYLYVAKCNSLFLRGKILGSKIQWWKKLLMGFPLLLTIILLLFGPLILFSSLNPLASLNEITGGYLQLSLKINKTNQYPFYINTHITDIHFMQQQPNKQLQQIIKTYELDQRSIQIVHLQPFSDQYWQISEGSYNKLIEQPEGSLYQLTMRVKFERNQTKTTPVYVLNTYTIPQYRVQQFKQTLKGGKSFKINKFVPAFMRLDNNNGLHFLTEQFFNLQFHAEQSRTIKKKYWVINDGITFRMASDKYSKAIFGYSVMSFYISIILVVANYFRFSFQGSSSTIIMSDLPYADPVLSICDGIHQARLRRDIYEQQMLFWTLIDIIRSPDLMKAITGNYLNARLETLENNQNMLQQKDEKEKDEQQQKLVDRQTEKQAKIKMEKDKKIQ